jgi:hypothetical protein
MLRHLSKLIVAMTVCLTISSVSAQDDVVVTLIFTNDMESAYEPVPAWWRDDIENIGGIAELTISCLMRVTYSPARYRG